MDMCHRDAIREGDGLAMMTLWRANMLRFWSGNHNKYFIAGHRLLAGSVYTHCLAQNRNIFTYITHLGSKEKKLTTVPLYFKTFFETTFC